MKLPRVLWLALALLPMVTCAAAAARAAKAEADRTYVRQDTFNLYRVEQRGHQDLRDTALMQLWRACQREQRCP